MIYAFFVINENGDIRLARAYIEMNQETRNHQEHQIYAILSQVMESKVFHSNEKFQLSTDHTLRFMLFQLLMNAKIH